MGFPWVCVMPERLRKFFLNFIQFLVTEMSNILYLSVSIVQVTWLSIVKMWCILDLSCTTVQVTWLSVF